MQLDKEHEQRAHLMGELEENTDQEKRKVVPPIYCEKHSLTKKDREGNNLCLPSGRRKHAERGLEGNTRPVNRSP